MTDVTRATNRPPKTVRDLLALPDETRAELIAGEIWMPPAPGPDHQRAVKNLCLVLETWVRGEPPWEVYLSPIDLFLPSGDVVEPDLVVGAPPDLTVERRGLVGVPALVVEVLSPAHPERDRVLKRDLYARNGIREFWIVDPESRTVEILGRRAEGYEPLVAAMVGDTCASSVLRGLEVPLDAVFRPAP